MLQVLGTRDGVEYELAQCETDSDAVRVQRREERNGYYSDVTVRDYDAYALDEHRKLPADELEPLAKRGDSYAREALAANAAAAAEAAAAEPAEPTGGDDA